MLLPSINPINLPSQMTKHYQALAQDCPVAVASAPSAEVGQRVRSAVQELGTACIELVKNGGACRANASDQFAKRDLTESSRVAQEKVSLLLAALHSGSRGTQVWRTG